MQDTPFRPSTVASTPYQKSIAKLVFTHATLDLYLNGGEVHAVVTGSLSEWDLRNLQAMSTGLYPLWAGLELEATYKDSLKDKACDLKLSRLLQAIQIPVHHKNI